ncbi:T3SS effector protein EspK [Xenorhabdus mauleonii]|uniref:T3SS effector protein EspK n=1 Tax=Xenorhabdus mauleonii TaxID=351675 RepID=A0A1I3KHC4_9GAMM|nr:hypothetical protein [Xenorhabdus mauleonii]PHM45053.1 T3SS effector protein EspK [Xenorhabdus mauleonii]SFI71921.1 hypothetical protein SAMN05421680_10387 [Xenorhabdus mauleonii]
MPFFNFFNRTYTISTTSTTPMTPATPTTLTVGVSQGDIVCGLNEERKRYVRDYAPFRLANIDNNLPIINVIPSIIDLYTFPLEIERSAQKKNVERRAFNMELPKQLPFKNSLNTYLKHSKYQSVLSSEYSDKYYRRKCKGGLSWVLMGQDPIAQKIKIHFILDGIDFKSVTRKNRKIEWGYHVTGSELRWLYRNRNHPNLKRKVQFWFQGEPSVPPWEREESKEVWQNYFPCSEDIHF